MEHLTKQQIVLLTLLVSFVTSIATGIVTVSLMDQTSTGITQTINQIVEKTIEKVSTATAVNVGDQTVQIVEQVSKSIVRIKPYGGDAQSVTGLGLVISKEGVILTDKANIAPSGGSVAIFQSGEEFPIQVIQSQINGDIVFATADIPAKKKNVISPLSFSSSIKLGEAVMTLSGKDLDILRQGIIGKVGTSSIETSISSIDIMIGSPLFSRDGEVLGFKTSSFLKGTDFYPINILKSSIPVLTI